MIVIVFGLPGSGKTYFAQRVAQMLHAIYIGSDSIRKELFKRPLYTEKEKALVYDEVMKRMIDKGADKEIVIDATFSNAETREKFLEEAKKISNIFLIEVWADEGLIKQRLSIARKDSDADFEVYKKLKSQWQPLRYKHLVLRSTNDNITEMLEHTFDYLFTKHGKGIY